MKLSQFKFKLPNDQVALHPTPLRDDCKLMVLHKSTGDIEHKTFSDILDYFSSDDLFVFNDTKVFPARLAGRKEKTNAKITVLLLRELNPDEFLWDVLVEPARKIRIGNKLFFGEAPDLVAEVTDNTTSRGRTLRFFYDGEHENFIKELYALGKAPITDLILKREPEPEDLEYYQTVYAKHDGAVVAPTAGLHFSKSLMKKLELLDIEQAYITMHCGLGNYTPTDVEDLTKHKTDSEELIVNSDCCMKVNKAKKEGHKILAVGASVMRGMEVTVAPDGNIKEFNGFTNKFIFPPYDFQVANCMLSNLHRPCSPMLMLTAAFGGYEKVMNAYKTAVKKDYHFGPYGDALLIVD